MTSTHLETALGYAHRGWRVHPLVPRDKKPLLKAWPAKATTDTAQIREWWTRHPTANIGLATGPESGIVVLDLDDREAFAQWQRTHRVTLHTVTANTGRGGRHYYCSYPRRVVLGNRTRFLPGADLRGAGGYVVAPPSRHPNGTHYAWRVSPEEAAITDLPPIILAAARTNHGRGAPAPINLGLAGAPPADKLHALLTRAKFRASWDRTRTDLQDTSPSGWDMSLAAHAALAGWTDQEIHSLLVENRRRHGDRHKRASYYSRTISRVRQTTRPPRKEPWNA